LRPGGIPVLTWDPSEPQHFKSLFGVVAHECLPPQESDCVHVFVAPLLVVGALHVAFFRTLDEVETTGKAWHWGLQPGGEIWYISLRWEFPAKLTAMAVDFWFGVHFLP